MNYKNLQIFFVFITVIVILFNCGGNENLKTGNVTGSSNSIQIVNDKMYPVESKFTPSKNITLSVGISGDMSAIASSTWTEANNKGTFGTSSISGETISVSYTVSSVIDTYLVSLTITDTASQQIIITKAIKVTDIFSIPADYSSLSKLISDELTGCTIYINSGNYNDNINFTHGNLTIIGDSTNYPVFRPVNSESIMSFNNIDNITMKYLSIRSGLFGFQIENSSNVTLEKIKIEYSGDYGIYSNKSELTINDCIINSSFNQSGISLNNSVALIDSSVIQNNSGNGITVKNGNIQLTNSIIRNNIKDGLNSETSTLKIINNSFQKNNENGIYAISSQFSSNCNYNVFYENVKNGIYLKGIAAELNHLTVTGNYSDGIKLTDSNYAKVKNSIITGNKNYGIYSEITNLEISNMIFNDNTTDSIFYMNTNLITGSKIYNSNPQLNEDLSPKPESDAIGNADDGDSIGAYTKIYKPPFKY